MPDYKEFPLADTAEGLTEAEILNWQVSPGDEVSVNQIVVEVETAKAAVELPIPWSGRVTELHVEPGQTVEVGASLLTIDLDPHGASPADASASSGGETTVAGGGQASDSSEESATEEMKPLVGYGSTERSTTRRPRKATAASAGASSADPGVGSTTGSTASPAGTSAGVSTAAATTTAASPEVVAGASPAAESTAFAAEGHVPLAKPPVRKLAKDLGVNLYTVTGSAAGGVITREDVRHAANGATVAAAPEQSAPSAALDDGSRETRVPIKGVRKATAQAMVESAFTAPHVTEFLSVDVTAMMEMRERLKQDPAFAGAKITPMVFAAKAMCLAAKRTPDVNASWDEDNQQIVYKHYVHLGVAAATPRGLVVPKVRDADSMSLVELANALEQLTTTARDGKTAPEDMLGGTITLSNVGVFGVDTGTPIINPGEAAILAFGTIRDTPWVVDGELRIRKVLQLSLSFDHRVVDGQQGSQYLADVGALLSDPAVAFTF